MSASGYSGSSMFSTAQSLSSACPQNFEFGLGNGVDRLHRLQVRRTDVENQTNVGIVKLDQTLDFTGSGHAKFHDGNFAIGIKFKDRKWHAKLVVEIAASGTGAIAGAQRWLRSDSCSRLAVGAGHGDLARLDTVQIQLRKFLHGRRACCRLRRRVTPGYNVAIRVHGRDRTTIDTRTA